ncbi:Spo0E family sporulation regulatory protein-aspartic acid phosphatase [Natronincola ferrireducens]|uniref:Spo0E like sporulation regulatory protein n=1 Tax=Natronincola ferrireducens TaxID=393762 RepID=A0A1G8ZEV1_9FIRM|nr:Spo0E family sporulation regulatory protein-aspartic acid phosphatase [Natronincola ferrireducens]SDK13558.1 Spo0E like sporulation regulatory protein [Natronincola ferrireducens]
MNDKESTLEKIRKQLNNVLEENDGKVTEKVIKISKELDSIIVAEVKKEKSS